MDVLDKARIWAFEPNPENFSRMRDDPALRKAGIELLPVERAMVFIVLLRRALRAMLADKNSSQLTN